eukprot:Platyproteum_vivax@DN5501_c0_g1_i1.p1
MKKWAVLECDSSMLEELVLSKMYYVKDDSWVSENPSGKAYACKLVAYQTPYSALNKGHYEKCLKRAFPEVRIVNDKDGPIDPPEGTSAPTRRPFPSQKPTEPKPSRPDWAPYVAGTKYNGGDKVSNNGGFF